MKAKKLFSALLVCFFSISVSFAQTSERAGTLFAGIMENILFKDVSGNTKYEIITNKIDRVNQEMNDKEQAYLNPAEEERRLKALRAIRARLIEEKNNLFITELKKQ